MAGINKVINGYLHEPLTIPPEIIIDMYVIDKMSSTEIGNELGCSPSYVLLVLKRNDIKTRSLSEGKKLALNKPKTKEKIREASRNRPLPESGKEKLRKRVGSKNHNWRSGITVTVQGYLQFTNSKANGEHANKLLHNIVVEWKYGRKLKKGEHTHHIDKNKLNNDPNNLIIMTDSDHSKTHTEDRENGKR